MRPSITELGIILMIMWEFILLGINVAAIGKLYGKVAGLDSENRFYRIPELANSIYDWLVWAPTRENARRLARSNSHVRVIHQLLIAILVVAVTVLIETGGVVAITGVAIAGYKLSGLSLDILELFRATVAIATLLAFSAIIHAECRLNQAY